VESSLIILQSLTYVVTIALMIYVARQVRKPDRLAGRLFARLMNSSHSTLTDWGLKHVAVEKQFTILDVGCGGGRTIQKLAALAPEGKVYGVDYASGSVATARATNSPLIQSGRVDIKQASVSQLPYADDQFDLVTAVETQYYWPDLVNDMKEILRVLKPGGTLLVIAESYKHGKHDRWQGPAMRLLGSTPLSIEDHRQLFSKSGYGEVQVFEEPKKGWFCGTARKPSHAA